MRQNICTKKTYTKDGAEKVSWLNVGKLAEYKGKKFIELNMFPNQTFYVFDEKEEQKTTTKNIASPTEELSGGDIPF
jgi:hypothetical protein